MDRLERTGCSYILGLPTNARLKDIAHPWCEDAATRRALAGKSKVRRFFQTFYAARSWSCERRVIARIEATAMGADARFIVTNLPGRAKPLYEKVYCARGRMENLIKEHKLYTKSDRTSCHRWEANQFRLYLHTAAYWLLHRLRGTAPKRSRWRTASFETIRRSFLKIAVRVEQLKTRIRLSLPSACPHAPIIALMLGRYALKAHERCGSRRRRVPNTSPQRPPKFTNIHTRSRRAIRCENTKRLHPDE